MPRQELLNNLSHQDLKVIPEFSAELGDNIASTLTFITEFAEVQKEYPILFRRDSDTGDFQAVVLFGIVKDENLFLTGEKNAFQKFPGWNANYIPAVIARGPFSIVYNKQIQNGEETIVPMINVDMDHPKISTTTGINVFLDQGGNSPYLDKISEILNIIRDGIDLNKSMFELFNKYELVESVNIDIDLINQDKHQLNGFFTINAEKLNTLSGDALKMLSHAGFLQAAYMVIASLSNIKKLIDLKNMQFKR